MSQLPERLRRVLVGLKTAGQSVPVLTVVMLLAIDICLRQGNPVDAMGYQSVDQWNLPPRIDFCRRTKPDMAMVGSSLLMALTLQPHEFINFNRTYPPYLQARLCEETHEDVICLSMCTGAQVVSEAYFVTRAILNQEDFPPVIVFGISMRDFLATAMTHEWDTNDFASLAPYVPVTPDVLDALSGWTARREFLLDHYSYLYRNHHDFSNVLVALAKNLLDMLPLDQPFARVSLQHSLMPSREGWLWEEWIPRTHGVNVGVITAYMTQLHRDAYSHGSVQSMDMQLHYLDRLASYCTRNGVTLVLVNMPLSDRIIALAPPGLHDAFDDCLQRAARQYRLPYLNLLRDREFKSSDFGDGAHLQYQASCRLADRIIAELRTNYPDVLKTIADHARMRRAINRN